MDAPGLVRHVVRSAFLVLVTCSSLWSQERLPPPSEGQALSVEDGDASFKLREEAEYFDEFITLGTPAGLGGSDWQRFERNHTKDLIRSFIPPLLRPAFVGHAFVLPPKAWQLSATGRLATIEGDDFFRDGIPNTAVFDNFEVDRQFFDLDLFYGFDLGREYLHNFTVRLSIPVSSAQTQGFVHPNGLPALSVFNEGENFELGDVGLFLKKKFVDQAVFPIQIAGAAGVRFPTGSNREKFNDNSRIKVSRPDLTGTGAPPPPPLDVPLLLTMLGAAPQVITEFPFNSGVFGRFSSDGRMPTTLQPGTGESSVFLGLFFTRVNQQYERFGRIAYHTGATYTFRFEEDGIDPGDQLVLFASVVKPVVRDLLSLDVSFVTFYQEADSYAGKFVNPIPTDAAGTPVAGGFGGGATHVTFRVEDRPPFVEGWTGFVAPSVIFSPDPSIRLTVSPLIRVIEPELGPAPEFVLRSAVEVIW